MRLTGLLVAFVISASACAKQHGEHEFDLQPVEPDPTLDAGLFEPWLPDAGFWLPFPLFDAGPGWPPDGSVLVDADPPAPADAGGWPGARQRVRASGPCPSAPTPVPATGCRDERWHEPSCYRTPVECRSLQQSSYCITLIDGHVHYVGMDDGWTCSDEQVRIPGAEDVRSLGRVGGDLVSCNAGVVQRAALSDGTFATAPLSCAAVFDIADQLVAYDPSSQSLAQYARWEDVGVGTPSLVAFASPGVLFAANTKYMVAHWEGSNEVAMLAIDRSSTKRVYLQDFDQRATGLDMSEDGRLFVAAAEGIWIFAADTGDFIGKLPVANAHGLSCHGPTVIAEPTLRLARRPGASGDDHWPIVAQLCRTPFTGPRYFADDGGPELVVIASPSTTEQTVVDQRSTPHVLLLTGGEGTRWTLHVAPDAKIERLIVSDAQQAALIQASGAQLPVELLQGRTAYRSHDGVTPGLAETLLRAEIEERVGRPITELVGCLDQGQFVVQDAPAPLCIHGAQ